ncbi:hypothetical protein MUK42_29079 [Musa troglodytarum]|uniref:Secreted protein n=1 Tax=Musa troglodytarum TaxID=320322 RepID=A0A9E7FM43_9LILI|nr:hypothetical protein MUK42_29079 [Musa troglodytarum]
MGCHQRSLFAAICVLCMLVSLPATVQLVSRGAPRSLVVNGAVVVSSPRYPAVCTIIGGVKVCNPPTIGQGSPQSRQTHAPVSRKP